MLSCPGLLFSEAASTQPPDSPLLTLALPNSHLHLHLHLATNPRAISQHHHSRTQHQLTFLPRAFSPRPPSPSPALSSRCSSRQPSPSRFWPASSLPRPISPLIPQSSVLLFEVNGARPSSIPAILSVAKQPTRTPATQTLSTSPVLAQTALLPASSTIPRQCQPSSAKRTSVSAMPQPSMIPTVLLRKPLASQLRKLTVGNSTLPTSPPCLQPRLRPQPLRPRAPDPLQAAPQQQVPPRQVPPPWLPCETLAVEHLLLVQVSFSAPFSKQAMLDVRGPPRTSLLFGDS